LGEEILIIQNEDIEQQAYMVRNIKEEKYEVGLINGLCQEGICFSSRYPKEVLYYTCLHPQREKALLYKHSNHPDIIFNNLCKLIPIFLEYFAEENVQTILKIREELEEIESS
jgi:hypothetical protein